MKAIHCARCGNLVGYEDEQHHSILCIPCGQTQLAKESTL